MKKFTTNQLGFSLPNDLNFCGCIDGRLNLPIDLSDMFYTQHAIGRGVCCGSSCTGIAWALKLTRNTISENMLILTMVYKDNEFVISSGKDTDNWKNRCPALTCYQSDGSIHGPAVIGRKNVPLVIMTTDAYV